MRCRGLGAESRGQTGEPRIDLAGRQITQLPGPELGHDVLRAEDRVLRDGRRGLSAESVREPVVYRVLDRVVIAATSEPVLMIA